MRTLLERYLPLREGEGGGAGGGAGAGQQQQQEAGAGGAGAAAADAGGSGAAAAATNLYRPDGLAEQFHGEKDSDTIDKLHTAVKGYRDRDAQRGVPDKVEAYAAIDADKLIGDMKLDAGVKPHLVGLNNDPIMAEVGAWALEQGIPTSHVQGIVGVAYQAAQKAGILDAFVDPAQEREALLPEAAKSLGKADQDKAINTRLQENEDFIKLLSAPGADGKPREGALPAEVAEHALLMLMDTAKGNQFVEWMRGQMTGGDKAQPFGGQGKNVGGEAKRDQLRAKLSAPEMHPQHPKFNREAHDALDNEYKALIGV